MRAASLRVAREVPGFDLVLFGHDHRQYNNKVRNVEGRDVVCLDPSSNALMVADATIALTMDKRGRVKDKKVEGCLTSVADLPVDQAYVTHFAATIDSIRTYVERPIGEFESAIYTRDCYFGNSAFSDFIHDLQLRFTGADISLNAPLSFDTHIQAGTVHMSDMFNLYRYENQLYVLRMTGEEVRKHLEMSYDLWVNTMHSPDDHIMLLSNDDSNDKQRFRFKNLAFNFDSACGIDYEVDVTKPDGEKVRILRMSNGQAFEPDKWYNVAMNSYRGNGGGELLTKGAGIPPEELKNRVIFRSERDQRYYLTEEIEKAGRLNPQAHHNWRFVPEEWTIPAIARDRQIIFGK